MANKNELPEVTEKKSLNELLRELEIESNRIASETYTENLVPVLRRVSGYTGEFTIEANSTERLIPTRDFLITL
jgi:hypothetical protein